MGTHTEHEHDDEEELPDGFCPGCAQPRFHDVIIHQPHCPFGRDCYDNPEQDW